MQFFIEDYKQHFDCSFLNEMHKMVLTYTINNQTFTALPMQIQLQSEGGFTNLYIDADLCSYSFTIEKQLGKCMTWVETQYGNFLIELCLNRIKLP